MLSSISPLGERARASRWWVTTAAYLLGSLAGGLALGLLAGSLGSLLPAAWRGSAPALGLAAALLLLGLWLDLRSGGHGVPSWRRQVDEQWLGRYRGWVYGVGFGAQLGFGLVTIVTSTTTYAAVLLAVLSGSPAAGLAIGGVFGLVRALPSVLLAGVHTPQQLHRVFSRVEQWTKPTDVVARVAVAASAAALAVAALGS
ncbi:MAG TPA: sulfite exporter TauE/SafE family protein [Pedococcus sp.]|jgi:MFS family permease